MKKFLAVLLVIMLAMGAGPALAEEVVSGKYKNVTWEYKKNVLTFYGTDEIPSYTGGLVVNYKYNYPWRIVADDVHKVVFDEGITKIDPEILGNMKFVEEIVIPSTLTEIEVRLVSLNKLDNIVVRLESIVVDENNPAYSSSDGVLFDKEKTRLIKYPQMKEGTDYTIPDSVKVIGENTFYHCDNLRKIVIGRNVKTIGKNAFQGCLNLEEVIFGDNIETIEDYAFIDCDNLKEIWLPKSLTNMGSYVFKYCDILAEIYYDGNEEMWRQITKADGYKELDRLIVYKYSDIGVTVNGKAVEFESYKYPYIKNERTMVPMRAIFEALGAEVTWDDESKTAIGVKDGVEVKITIGENVIYKNGEAIEIDAAAELKSESTMVPVRAISEAFGCGVEWDDKTKAVEITY